MADWYVVEISTEGISSMQIAYYDANGDRQPSSGYKTYSFSSGESRQFYIKAGMKLYIHKIIRFEDGYGCPWTYAIQSEIDPTVSCGATGNTENVSLHIIPNAYCTVQILATYSGGPERPDNWSWWSTISPGSAIAITAEEWNAFTARINEFRDYYGLDRYWFTTATSGMVISYWIVNQARTAISEISGHGSLPSAAVSGGKIHASFFNSLASALNSIP